MPAPNTLTILDAEAWQIPLHTRMPFRYGIATVTDLPHVGVRVRVAVGGREVTGWAADHLAPKWFTKNPDTSFAEDIAEMTRVIHHALDTAKGMTAPTPFALWYDLYTRQAAWGAAQGLAPLLTNFGVSLVERAVLDAWCQAQGEPLHRQLLGGGLGVDLAAIHPGLDGLAPADLLPTAPLARVWARHTVGLLDPLDNADIAPDAQVNDGLPQSLASCIGVYGLRHFKLKVGANPGDADRLERILRCIGQNAEGDWKFSVDGNESYRTLATFRDLWEECLRRPVIAEAVRAGRLLFVEQPLHRDIALSGEIAEAFGQWPHHPPFIIDESDATLASLPTALRLGYQGTSHKNCKGVFKGVANACLLEHYRRTRRADLILSGEDLSNVGPVALCQDLAVQATLGIESVERNGHHYFAGLSQWPEALAGATLAAHPDLFHRTAGGFLTLTITSGAIELGTVNAAPLGCGLALTPDDFAEAL